MDLYIFFVLLFFVHVNVASVVMPRVPDGHQIRKRSMDIELCIDRFDIHSNKIIRTDESINMGAKFIADVELMSHDQCLRLCCETEGCNVFVYEEKIRGTCFLFECGPSENFRCKFTEHTNYTSAILDLRRPLMPVTESHPLNVHEAALNKLKRPTTTTTTASPSVQVVPKSTASSDKSLNVAAGTGCKRFEFQCHIAGNEGGCIGIYNVCDGIPQCEDSSDEIECPPVAVASNTKSVKTPDPQTRYGPQISEIGMKVKPYQIPESNSNRMQVQQQMTLVQNQLPMMLPNNNNREDPLTSPKLTWQTHQGSNENLQYQDTESHIFNHKNGLQLPATNILQPYGDRMRDSYAPLGPDTMYQTQQQQPMLSQQQPGPQWMTDPHGTRSFNNWQQQQSQQQQQPPMLPQEMSMNSMQAQLAQQQQNKAIFGQVPGQVPGNWVPVRQGPLQEQGVGLQGSQNGQMPIIAQVPVANVVSQGSSGDESGQKSGDVSKDSDSKDENTSEEEEESDSVTTEAPKKQRKHKKPKDKTPSNGHSQDSSSHHEHLVKSQYAHLKNQLDMEFVDHDGFSDRPSGAVLSLTLGIILMAALAVLITCRLRVAARRMRRLPKGAGGYDADFLVNGMYL